MKSLFLSTAALVLQASASPFNATLLDSFDKRQDARAWRDITCDFGSLTSVSNDPVQQWIDSKAEDAMRECLDAFNANNMGLTFSNFVFNFFNGRPGPSCGALENSNCDVSINCGQAGTPNAPVNSPAGYVILNSMIGLHVQYESYFLGLQGALNYLNGQVGHFAEVFAPQFDPLENDKILLDVVNLLFAVVSAGTFNSWLKNIPYFKGQNGNTLGVIKDTTNAEVAATINLVKDTTDALDKLKVQNTLADFLSTTVQSWSATLQKMSTHVFEEDSVLGYFSFVNAKSWTPNAAPYAFDITQTVMQTLYAYMIPVGWKLSTQAEVGAFIATADGLTKNGPGCGDYALPTDRVGTQIAVWDDNVLANNFVCLDGVPYWILNIGRTNTPVNQCGSNPLSPGVCPNNFPGVHGAPGIDKLDGQDYNGLTRDMLVRSAVSSWQKNGNKNGWPSADASTPDGMQDVIDNGIFAQGVVNIPVCSMTEAIGNGFPDFNGDNWPCNS